MKWPDAGCTPLSVLLLCAPPHSPWHLPDGLSHLHPLRTGAVLQQHPRPFQEHAVPWLRQALGWGDAELASAALTPSFGQLCRLDTQQAQRWVRHGAAACEDAGDCCA